MALSAASCGKKVDPALLGVWQGANNGKSYTLSFAKDGRLRLNGDVASLGKLLRSFTLMTDFNLIPGENMPITYRCISATQMEVEGDLSVLLEKLSSGGTGKPDPEMLKMLHPKETLTFAATESELTLSNDKGDRVTLQRLK